MGLDAFIITRDDEHQVSHKSVISIMSKCVCVCVWLFFEWSSLNFISVIDFSQSFFFLTLST